MQPQAMLAASLVERFLRAGESPRHSAAYYLSRSEQGHSKLTYVKKEERDAVRLQGAAYRAFHRTCGHGGGSPLPGNSDGGNCSRPSLDKTFLSFLSISLNNRPKVCPK